MDKIAEIQKILEELGGAAQIAEELKRFTRDCAYISDHWAELLQQYPNRWIAVMGGRVTASADTLSSLVHDIPEKDRRFVKIDFMDTHPKPLIVAAA